MCSSSYFIVLLFAAATLLDTSIAQGPAVVVQAVQKGSASLPCDMTAPVANDSVLLVVWYKSDMRPIYSYDLRKKDLKDNHWFDKDTLGGRAYFRTMSEPAALVIDTVNLTDAADYRCRVDFRKSPTRNYKVKLVVTVPPDKPFIIDDRQKEIQEMAGPYEEGSEMNLRCIVTGGQPPPTIRWYRGTSLLEAKEVNNSRLPGEPQAKESRLTVKKLDRSDLHATYTCSANNNNVSAPVTASVKVEIYFKPLSAAIISSYVPLSADRPVEVVCQAVGSRPPAQISWWMDNKQLKEYSETKSADGNITISTLKLKPTMMDNEKTLTCRAENDRVMGSAEEASWKLNIHYIPVSQLELGSKMNPNAIEEGNDVYFECKIHSNPPVYKVVWKHNNQNVRHNQKLGVIVSNQALALQSVRKNQAGNYTCLASNVEGDGESNTVTLRVMYPPVCRPDQKRVYGVAKGERANVMCEVDAYPPPDSFMWTFNNSASTAEVPPNRFSSPHHSLSTLTCQPQSELDYGTVMCWATNTAGKQKEPCLFHIIAAGHPDPPLNCTVTNQTSESLEVDCLEGFDGGQQQQFHLVVYELDSQIPIANKTSKKPSFVVGGLGPGRILKLIVFASNGKGRSEDISVEGFTLKVAEKQTGTPAAFELTPVIGVLILAITLLLISSVIILGALRLRGGGGGPARPQVLAMKDKASLPLRSDVQDLYDMDDKNPDLIPCNKGSDYQLVSNAGTPAPGDSATPPPCPPLYEETHPQPRNNSIARNGDLYDNYKNNYLSQRPVEDVTYAELCLTRPTSLVDPGYRGGGREPTIYAEIDHGRRTLPHQLVSPATHREVVTVRTPLMGSQQESCV